MQEESAVTSVLNAMTACIQEWVAQFMAIAIPLVVALYIAIFIMFIIKRIKKKNGNIKDEGCE